MVSIEERISSHEIENRKLNDKKHMLENELSIIDRKIAYHWAAIINLLEKYKQNLK